MVSFKIIILRSKYAKKETHKPFSRKILNIPNERCRLHIIWLSKIKKYDHRNMPEHHISTSKFFFLKYQTLIFLPLFFEGVKKDNF